jgi:hypothetical protein
VYNLINDVMMLSYRWQSRVITNPILPEGQILCTPDEPINPLSCDLELVKCNVNLPADRRVWTRVVESGLGVDVY